MSAPVDLYSYVIRRIVPWDNPNIAQVQPKWEENEEIAGESVHLILKQHYIGICVWIYLPTCCYHSKLGYCLDSYIAAHISCRVAAQWWRTFPGESRNAAFLNVPDPASLTVIGNRSSSLSYYISPLGYPRNPWDYFTQWSPSQWDPKYSRPMKTGIFVSQSIMGPSQSSPAYNEWKEHSIKHHHLQILENPQLMQESAYFSMYDRQQMCANAFAEQVHCQRISKRRGAKGAKRFAFPQDAGLFLLDISFKQSMWHRRQRWFILPSNHTKSKNKHGFCDCRCRCEVNADLAAIKSPVSSGVADVLVVAGTAGGHRPFLPPEE